MVTSVATIVRLWGVGPMWLKFVSGRKTIPTTLVAAITAALLATGMTAPVAVAATVSARAAKCIITGPGGGPCPKLGAYYPSPRKVQLPKGSTYTTTIAYDNVTDYSKQASGTVPTAFIVEWTVTAQKTTTITCQLNGHQLIPSDTHMNLYLNGTDLGYVPAYKLTCGDNPNFKVVLKPGKSTNYFVKFHFTPHPGYEISISQLSYSTVIFHPFGSRVRLPYQSKGPGSLSKAQVKKDLSYAKSFLVDLLHGIGDNLNSFGLNLDQWQALGQLIFEIPSCSASLSLGNPNQDCFNAFTDFLNFTAPPVS